MHSPAFGTPESLLTALRVINILFVVLFGSEALVKVTFVAFITNILLMQHRNSHNTTRQCS